MIKPPLGLRMESYEVECEVCGLSEIMTFVKNRFFGRRCPYEDDNNQVLKPIRGWFGDKPPRICPKCGEVLNVSELPLPLILTGARRIQIGRQSVSKLMIKNLHKYSFLAVYPRTFQ